MKDREEVLARFLSHVEKTETHWLWTAFKNLGGYGMFGIGKKVIRAHRVAYELFKGDIPEGLDVLHKRGTCNIRHCVNPDHLYAGDDFDNAQDKEVQGRGNHATGEKNGSRTHPESRPRGEKHGLQVHPEARARGEKNGACQLTESQVLEIRKLALESMTLAVIARRFHVSWGAIKNIVHRKTWAHLLEKEGS